VKKSATLAEARTTPFVDQRLATVNSGVFRFLHSFSVSAGVAQIFNLLYRRLAVG